MLAEASGKEDREGAQHYSASAFWALTGVGALTGIIALATFRLIPWRRVFSRSPRPPRLMNCNLLAP